MGSCDILPINTAVMDIRAPPSTGSGIMMNSADSLPRMPINMYNIATTTNTHRLATCNKIVQ